MRLRPEQPGRFAAALIGRRPVLAALGASVLAGRAQASDLPAQVSVIVPCPAGGGNEKAARIVAKQVAKATQKSFTVEVRAGQNGNIGALFVARAKPDGGTWLFGP